uniref:Centlein-like n=1 Tax=Saccoglossus kowalevskii TaxID=10224 RepID=A0ABM0LVC1_SACKO|nr:PREDICTED: centlein-like [Saccoglossus kowalevskii]
MASPERSKDAEISRLRAENQALADELAQCQADKEFVWSLWKRLQVASPDMTQAISLVLQREKEKAEIKDRKVLEILRIKDERISELDKLLTQQQQELNDFVARKIYLDEENSVLNRENRDLKEKRRSLEELLQSRESRLKTSEDLNRQVIDNLDRDKQDLTTRVTELLVESDKAKDEIHQVKKANSCLENKLKIVEADLREKTREHDRLMREHEDTLTRLQNHDIQTQKQDREDRNKERDNEKLRKELNELNALHNQCSEHASQQADLIRQLQSLQFDTQKIMKNQEEAHTMESSSLQSMYSDLNSRYQALKADFDNSERHLSTIPARNVSMQVNFAPWDAEVQVCESCVINECKMTSLQTEVDLLKERLKEKSRLIYAMDKEDPDKEYDLSLTRSKRRSMVENTGSSHFSSGNRSRSLSPMRAPLHTSSPKQRRSAGISTDKKTDDLEKLLKLKNAEIEDLRAAHDRRLARLRALQHNYNILKEQIKTYEEENSGRKKKKKMHRSDPRKLQQEDSDSVWNELAYFKGHNRNLLMERMNLQEELDLLKVQTAADAAHVGELTRCLQQEKEQLKGQLAEAERSRKIKDTERKEISEQKRKIKSLEKLLERLESESNDLIDERDNLVKEKRNLKNEISRLKQELLEKDGEVTEVRKENHYLTKKLRQRKLSRNKARRCKSVKEHQRALNRSIQHMSALFSDFDEDGWEEISTDSGGEETGDSLGDRIVRTATSPDLTCRTLDRSLRRRRRRHDSSGRSISPRSITKPSKRQAASIHGHIKRLAKRYEVNESERKLKWSNIGVQTDDEAPRPCNHLTVIGVGDNSVTDYTNNTTIDTTIVRRRDIATSPHMGLAKLGKSLNRSHRLESPSMSSLKQRLGSLQQQVTVLRDSKACYKKV